jgi:dUTP pyrophosphatase
LKKQRGFQAVSRLKKENIKPIYPKRNDVKSAGYDFYYFYKEPIVIKPGETKFIKSGIKAFMLDDEVLEINTRSGNGCKKNIVCANSIGWIDASYYNNSDNEGEIIVALRNEGAEPFIIEYGDKYCQAKFSKYLLADIDIVVNKKRKGGLGHSGRK